MNGLSTVNIELTSRCCKSCWMCGRRKLEKNYPELTNWGDMPYEMLEEIERQIPKGIVVQLHNNGEPLLYPRLGDALRLFAGRLRSFNTNAKLLLDRADEIIGNLETLVISVIQDDPEGDEQYDIVRKFVSGLHSRKPFMVYRLLGRVDHAERWGQLPGIVARRILHSPEGSRDYTRPVTVPEIGICLDLLHHLAIDRFGDVSVCVRFDPERKGVVGKLHGQTLEEIWNGPMRKYFIEEHLKGQRSSLFLCSKCDFYGVPRGD